MNVRVQPRTARNTALSSETISFTDLTGYLEQHHLEPAAWMLDCRRPVMVVMLHTRPAKTGGPVEVTIRE